MSTIAERIRRSEAEGFWAVEVRLAEWAGHGRRYLCHGESDRNAKRMAGRLMGSGGDVRGYDYYRIDGPLKAAVFASPPALGASTEVRASAQWDSLMDAHRVSEAAYRDKLSKLETAAHAA
jgi:hypothetical protein